MRNKIYLYTSNVACTEFIRKDSKFQPTYEYCPFSEGHNTLRNEYGRIRTKENDYHIIVGDLRAEGCAWCQHPLDVIFNEEEPVFELDRNKFTCFCLCKNCGSKGPEKSLRIYDPSEDAMDHLRALILYNYSQRASWEKLAKVEESK